MGKYSKQKRKPRHLSRRQIVKIQKSVILLSILLLAIFITSISQRLKYEKIIEEMEATHREDMIALRIELRDEHESEMRELEQYYEYGGDVEEIEREAEWLARLGYGMYRPNHKDSDIRAIFWCALNRVDNPAYPNSVQGVCQQKNQWIGYSDDNPVIAKLYDLALEELKKWHNNEPRPMSSDYVYLTWSSSEILLRDTFAENKSTTYWRMN